MNDVRAVGMVIYTYAVLEERLEALWDWLTQVEEWVGHAVAEFAFDSRAKQSFRIWKASPQNRDTLYQRLKTEQPWSIVDFAYPRGGLRDWPYKTHGFQVAFGSRRQPWRGGESVRGPSYIYLEVHPDIVAHSTTGIAGLLELGKNLWDIVAAVYGFIDVETGVPLHDDLSRNVIHLFDSTVPKEYHQEYRQWQELESQLDKRVWKAFWGNFLGSDHLRQLGGLQDMRRAHPRYSILPEYLTASYEKGVERLRNCDCVYEWQSLAREGVLLTLSASPLEWFEPTTQEQRLALDAALAPIALSAPSEAGA